MASSTNASSMYQEVSREEALWITDGISKHAAHVMLYAKVDKKLFARYDIKYAILVSCSVRNMVRTLKIQEFDDFQRVYPLEAV